MVGGCPDTKAGGLDRARDQAPGGHHTEYELTRRTLPLTGTDDVTLVVAGGRTVDRSLEVGSEEIRPTGHRGVVQDQVVYECQYQVQTPTQDGT